MKAIPKSNFEISQLTMINFIIFPGFFPGCEKWFNSLQKIHQGN
jgi:hypothetical protein